MADPPLFPDTGVGLAYVTSSVGWLGAIVGFLALAVVVLTSQDARMVRAAYPAAEATAWFVIVPLSLASLLTGVALATPTAVAVP